MKPSQRLLLFIILPIIAILFFPPETLLSGLGVILVALAAFVLLGVMEWRGVTWALVLSIFIQGVNVIVRLMLFLRHAVPVAEQPPDILFIITSLVSIALSLWLMLRLDRVDVRVTMVR
jgi:hypothetical protein